MKTLSSEHMPTAPSVRRGPRVFSILVLVLVVGGVALLTWIFSLSQSLPPAPARERETIQAGVVFTGTQVQVRNVGPSPWTETTVAINPGVIDGGYSVYAGSVQPGATASIGVLQFANGAGERFNPVRLKATTIRVSAHVGGQLDIKSFVLP